MNVSPNPHHDRTHRGSTSWCLCKDRREREGKVSTQREGPGHFLEGFTAHFHPDH